MSWNQGYPYTPLEGSNSHASGVAATARAVVECVVPSIAVENAARLEASLGGGQVLEQVHSASAGNLCDGGELIESDGDKGGECCQQGVESM